MRWRSKACARTLSIPAPTAHCHVHHSIDRPGRSRRGTEPTVRRHAGAVPRGRTDSVCHNASSTRPAGGFSDRYARQETTPNAPIARPRTTYAVILQVCVVVPLICFPPDATGLAAGAAEGGRRSGEASGRDGLGRPRNRRGTNLRQPFVSDSGSDRIRRSGGGIVFRVTMTPHCGC